MLHNACIVKGDIWKDYEEARDRDTDPMTSGAPEWLRVRRGMPLAPTTNERGEDAQARAVRDGLVFTARKNWRV